MTTPIVRAPVLQVALDRHEAASGQVVACALQREGLQGFLQAGFTVEDIHPTYRPLAAALLEHGAGYKDGLDLVADHALDLSLRAMELAENPPLGYPRADAAHRRLRITAAEVALARAWVSYDVDGVVAARVALQEAEAGTGASGGRGFEFASLSEMLAEPKAPVWLIRDFIEARSLSVLFGDPASFKSFVAQGMGMSIATATGWYGRTVTPGPVFYIAGEGLGGLPRRLRAWTLENNCGSEVPFFVSKTGAQFLDRQSADQVRQAAEVLADQHGPAQLLVVDTLSRCFGPGDENSNTDMAAFVAEMDRLRDSLQCAVLVVHHSGLGDKSRGRGASALHAGVDFEYRLSRVGDAVTMKATKCKDHEPPPDLTFSPVTIPLGWYDLETGDELTSLVLRQTDAPLAQPKPILKGATRIAFEALVKITNQHCTPDGHLPDRMLISQNEWREQAYTDGVSPAGTPDAKRLAFNRAVLRLLDLGMIETTDDNYCIKS